MSALGALRTIRMFAYEEPESAFRDKVFALADHAIVEHVDHLKETQTIVDEDFFRQLRACVDANSLTGALVFGEYVEDRIANLLAERDEP